MLLIPMRYPIEIVKILFSNLEAEKPLMNYRYHHPIRTTNLANHKCILVSNYDLVDIGR